MQYRIGQGHRRRRGGSSNPEHLTAVGDTLYFSADDGTTGVELWKSDGTGAGTERVRNIRSGSGDSNPTEFVALGDTLYFTADDGIHGYELWKSNGTTTGTKMVNDIHPSGGSHPSYPIRVGDTIYNGRGRRDECVAR